MKEFETQPAEELIADTVAERRHHLSEETKLEQGKFGLFQDRIHKLTLKIGALQEALQRQLTGFQKGDSAQIFKQLNALSHDLDTFSSKKEQIEAHLKELEIRADSIRAAFDPESPEHN